MELTDIVEVKETRDVDEVNKLLKDGWIILSTGLYDEQRPGYGNHTYSLGLPEDVAASLNPKKYPDGVNF